MISHKAYMMEKKKLTKCNTNQYNNKHLLEIDSSF
jgi:hypothetical protein